MGKLDDEKTEKQTVKPLDTTGARDNNLRNFGGKPVCCVAGARKPPHREKRMVCLPTAHAGVFAPKLPAR